MKKLLFAVLAISLVAAACNKQTDQNQNQNQNQNGNQNQQQSQTQTYSNATYGFSFDYPADLQFVTPTYPNLEDKIVQVQIPQNAYPGTNFGDAAFAVSAQSAKSLSDCLKLTPPENGDGFKTKVTINGADWYMTKSSGAGAGNLYDSTIYRTVKSTGGACVELNETIHTSNIGNYPSGTVTQVDSTAVQTRLDDILNTFKFTN